MQITKEEMDRRLNSPKNLVNSLGGRQIIPEKTLHIVKELPRAENTPHAPRSLQIIAGALAHIEPVKSVAGELGMSESQVQRAKKLPEAKSTVERVQDLALDMLLDSLGLLTVNHIRGESPKDVSIIAKNLSGIYNNVRPHREIDARTQVLVYAPQQRELDDFRAIEVVIK